MRVHQEEQIYHNAFSFESNQKVSIKDKEIVIKADRNLFAIDY